MKTKQAEEKKVGGELLAMLDKMAGLERKANEVMHSGNTGYGAEFIPPAELMNEIQDILPKFSYLVPLLPGNHGINMPKSLIVPVKGLTVGDTFFQGKGEWTTGRTSTVEGTGIQSKVPTTKVQIDQKSFIVEVDISDEQLKYDGPGTEQYVKDEIARGMAMTIDSVIINGDATTAGTGNVNSDDQAPATTYAAVGGATYHTLIIDNGIRKRAIAGSYTKNFGTLADTDYTDLMTVVGRYATNPADLLFIQSIQVTNKAKALDAFKFYNNSADKAGIQKAITPTPFGVDILTTHLVPLTEADGKKSGATPANNVLGQTLLIYKPAIQFGWGQDFKLEMVRVPGYGYRLVATFDFGFTIVDSAASLAEPTVAAGINITV